MNERWVVLDSPALQDEAEIRELQGKEVLNQLFAYRLVIVLRDQLDATERAAALLDRPITLRFIDQGEVVRRVHGIASDVSVTPDLEHELTRISLTLVPRAWLMTQRFGAEVFLGQSVVQVLAAKLAAVGLRPETDFVMALQEDYPAREIIVQYEETDHAFFSRWCEHEGIITFFEHRDGRDVLVLTDYAETLRPIDHPALPHRSRRDHPAAYDITTKLQRLPEHAQVHDYNYRTPAVALDDSRDIERRKVSGRWVEYGAHTKSLNETRRIATARAQELAARHHVVTGSSSELSMRAGGTFVLQGGGSQDQELLITELRYAVEAGEGRRSFDNRFTAIPAATPYRPERRTPRPRVNGLLNARVDGAIKGHYAELDEHGRYHVSLALDRSGRTDLQASHPVRMMQPHAGSHYGMHFPLRPGTEVLIGFVDGNPDRPVIVGTAPNPETWSPVVAGNQTQNVLRTGSNNEMVIEDEHGTERIRIHTPKHDTTFQLGAHEEPEEGALTTTQASISEASRESNNQATGRKTVMARSSSMLLGDSAYLLAGLEGIAQAAEAGFHQPSALSLGNVYKSLASLGMEPEERQADPLADSPEQDVQLPGDVGGGMWSGIGAAMHAQAESAAFNAVRALAQAADLTASTAMGRSQGEPLGALLGPGVISGSPVTSAMFGRDSAFVYGDRVAALGSYDSAHVVGQEHAAVKSPGHVELAGGELTYITSAGTIDVAGNLVRVVGGYYPQAEAPPLDEGTSIGVMSRRDLRLLSVEDCILVCAQKNLIGSAHSGDIRLTADGSVALKGASIDGSAGSVSLHSGSTTIKADGDIVIEGASVTIKAGLIKLDGHVECTQQAIVAGLLKGNPVIGG